MERGKPKQNEGDEETENESKSGWWPCVSYRTPAVNQNKAQPLGNREMIDPPAGIDGKRRKLIDVGSCSWTRLLDRKETQETEKSESLAVAGGFSIVIYIRM
jgi:hypothetical protein